MKNDQSNIQNLLDIMSQLRDPESGCPWDLQQDFSTIAPYTIEELSLIHISEPTRPPLLSRMPSSA